MVGQIPEGLVNHCMLQRSTRMFSHILLMHLGFRKPSGFFVEQPQVFLGMHAAKPQHPALIKGTPSDVVGHVCRSALHYLLEFYSQLQT